MKSLFFGTIFLVLISAFPVVTMAAVDINAGISLFPPIVFEAPSEVMVMPDSNGLYIVAEADAATPQDGPTSRVEEQRDESLEKKKTTESKDKSDWKINVWPVQPQDKSFPERKEEEKRHIPPDRF